jgi:hypothetical protein
VYGVPFVSPVTVIGEEAPETVIRSGLDTAKYALMADPPGLAGAENDTVAWVSPPDAVTPVGASGFFSGS